VSIDLATGQVGKAIRVGRNPGAVVITPDGKTAYAVSYLHALTPVDLPSRTPGQVIRAGKAPVTMAITPDGSTGYVVSLDGAVVPVDLGTGRPGKAISVGPRRRASGGGRAAAPMFLRR